MKSDIVFFQQYAVPYFGVLSLAAHIKHNAYKAEVVIDSLEEDSLEILKKLKPRIIGISVLTTEHKWLIEKTKAIRNSFPDTIVVVGGIHAMFYSEEILKDTEADLVCNSEGEQVLLSVIEKLGKNRHDWATVPGLTYRDNRGHICKNERAPLVLFDDDIIEDRAIYYDRYPQLAQDSAHRFFSSRGCPYKCSFCYNTNIQEIFKNKGTYLRHKSVENFIKELINQCDKYPIKFIFFYDDLFTYKKKWLKEFLNIYKKQVNIPFMCTTRADLMDEETAQLLSDAGCRTASFGIETGNYELRREILKKNISDEKIIKCGHFLEKYGIKIQTSNMFCLPGESLEDAFKTIELNIKIKTNFAFCAIFLPLPKTEITDYCVEKGLLKSNYSLKDMPHSFLTYSGLDIPEKEVIKNIYRLAYYFIKYPWLYKLFKNWPRYNFLDHIFQLLFLLSNFFRHKEERGISYWSAFKYSWRMRKSF